MQPKILPVQSWPDKSIAPPITHAGDLRMIRQSLKRFGERIMRPLLVESAIGRKTVNSLLLIAFCSRREYGKTVEALQSRAS
jgi:hypothetical protein